MDQNIAEAKRKDRAAVTSGDEDEMRQARVELRRARRRKTTAMREWEVQWLKAKAEEANELAEKPNASLVFGVVRELTRGATRKKGDGGVFVGLNQQEVEAWKEHFCAIQAGRGDILEEVWQDVENRDVYMDLDDPPSREEVRRAIKAMKLGKAGGEDAMVAEYLKMGGPEMQGLVFRIVTRCWEAATRAADGQEHTSWPTLWKSGVIIPLWKKKGDRKNKNTWRGITLLLVGSKLVARICAIRLQRWSQSWLNPLQFGFRAGSGVDDVQQVSRRLLEEAAQSAHTQTYLMRFFDLEKAYPKVARHGLWTALIRKGCPGGFLKVLKAIHEGTASKVRLQGFESSSFVPDRQGAKGRLSLLSHPVQHIPSLLYGGISRAKGQSSPST